MIFYFVAFFVDKLLVLLFKCKFSEWLADFSCIMGDLHEKRWRFYFFFLWLTPAEEGSQARSHKITLTEFIRLALDDKNSMYTTHLSKRTLKSKRICHFFERTQFSKGLSIDQKMCLFFILFAFLHLYSEQKHSDFNLWIVSYKSL